MGLIDRIKSALGLGSSASPSRPGAGRDRRSPGEEAGPGDGPVAGDVERDEQGESRSDGTPGDAADAGVDVTVEHDPAGASDAGTEATTPADAPATGAEDAVKGTDTAEASSERAGDLEDLKGIGPAYAERLREAGVESVDALAGADADALAEETGIAAARVQKWVDRASAR